MKDKNGIEVCCENCRHYEYCHDKFYPDEVKGGGCYNFEPSVAAYEARIADLEKKLTETIKLLGERSRECGKLQALLEVKNRSNMSMQSTDADDVSKNGEKSTESKER